MAENERQRERETVGEEQRAQWDTWSWCHAAKVGVISQEAKFVFIGSLGVRDLWVRVVSWEKRGTSEGGKYVICQQTVGTNGSRVP